MRLCGIKLIFTIMGILYSISFCSPTIAITDKPIQVALVLAKTGIAMEDNKPAILGAQLAIDEINTSGGLLGRSIDLIQIDNKSSALGSKLAAQKAIALDVCTVIGPLWSSHSLSMAPILQKAGIPMITPSATKPEITLAGNYIFRTGINDILQGRVLAKFAHTDLNSRRAAVLKIINEEYSISLAEYFTHFFSKRGGETVYEGNYKGSAIDFTDILSETQKNNPDIIFIPGYSRDSGLIIKQARKMGISAQFIGGDGWGNQMYEYANESIEGCYYTTQWHWNVPNPINRHVQKQYHDKYGKDNRDMRVPLTYDAMMVFAAAVKRANSSDRKKIRDALSQTQNFKGATGTISFDQNGDPLNKEAIILKFEKGSSIFVKSATP